MILKRKDEELNRVRRDRHISRSEGGEIGATRDGGTERSKDRVIKSFEGARAQGIRRSKRFKGSRDRASVLESH